MDDPDLTEREILIIVVTYCVYTVCFTILLSFLFVALWDYRVWVGVSLLAMLGVLVLVYARGKIAQQDIRKMFMSQHTEKQEEQLRW